MGLYFRRTPWATRDEPSASVTWCEYMSALAAAIDPDACPLVVAHPDRPPLPRSARRQDASEEARLRERLRRAPENAAAHRSLGLCHLARGQIGPAARHLDIALGLVRREADRGVVLTDALRLQLEAATLRLVLMRLHMRLGNVTRAGALAQEGHAVL
jgi:hypothetical protein